MTDVVVRPPRRDVGAPQPAPGEGAVPSARDDVSAFVDRWSVALRSAAGIGTAVVGLLTRAPSAGTPVLLALGAWSLARLVARDRARSTRLLLVDVVVVLALVLATPLLCTAEEARSLSGLTAAALAAASATLVWQLRGARPVLWCAAGMAAAALGGAMVPGVRPSEVLVVWFLPLQSTVVWLLMAVLRAGAARADREALALAETRRGTDLAAARRAAEREHWAILHDTAAATLVVVGGGVPDGAAERVRRQARRDLDALLTPAPQPDGEAGDALPLGPVLRGVLAEQGLRTTLSDPHGVAVPQPVGAALRDAVRELLTNVERHAGVDWASVEVGRDDTGGVWVEVRDTGRGIGAGTREGRGLRESVRARVGRVGGEVTVAPHEPGGTLVRLRWPAEAS